MTAHVGEPNLYLLVDLEDGSRKNIRSPEVAEWTPTGVRFKWLYHMLIGEKVIGCEIKSPWPLDNTLRTYKKPMKNGSIEFTYTVTFRECATE